MNIMVSFKFLKKKKKNHNSRQKTFSEVELPKYIVTLDGKTFEDFIQKYPLSVVDFWALWCAPCKAMSPRLRRLSNIYRGKVAFGKLDIQKNRNIAKQYKVVGIPHLIFFSYGKKISGVTGLKSIGEIKNMIEDLLNSKNS